MNKETGQKKMLSLPLPFRPDRVMKIVDAVNLGKQTRDELLQSVLENSSWYARMAETYLQYSKQWGLADIGPDVCRLTSLGEAVLLLHRDGFQNLATGLIYYGCASSTSFTTVGTVAKALFKRLEEHGPFTFTNADLSSRFVPELEGRSDLSNLSKTFERAGILQGERHGGKLTYRTDYYEPPVGSFAISLLHHIQILALVPPHGVQRFDKFRVWWLLSKDSFMKGLRQCRANDWVSYQEFADINQFQFRLQDLVQLTKDIIVKGHG